MNIRTYIMNKVNAKQYKEMYNYTKAYSNYDQLYDPRLDDEGTYDYLANYIPMNNTLWYWEPRKESWKCDSCGKQRGLYNVATAYWYTYDGYDSDSYRTCWHCEATRKLHNIKYKLKNKRKQ